jgi:biotin carboxyl carrier protein
MAGKLISIDVKVGDAVKKGDAVATVEAMKMHVKVFAPADGTVKSIDAEVNTNIDPTKTIVTLE